MMQAGWYRYFMSWSFAADGTIQPRVGFTTNGSNPLQGIKHTHHAYLHLDFDIDTPVNNAISESYLSLIPQPFPLPPIIVPKLDVYQFETKVYRGSVIAPTWTVSNPATSDAYQIAPRSMDGTALGDSFGVGDIWAFAYNFSQLDDGVAKLSHPAYIQIDKYLNNDPIYQKDVVVWYGVHFVHDPSVMHGMKDLGPDLKPLHW